VLEWVGLRLIEIFWLYLVYRKDLDSAIRSEQGGDLGRILRSIASGGRASNHGRIKFA
jgi:hypothetical protein